MAKFDIESNYPKTAEEWWAEVAAIKNDIKEWGPTDRPVAPYATHPLAPGRMGKKLVEYYKAQGDKTFWTVFDELEAAKDPLLYHVLNSIWLDAPDKPYIHSWKSWGRFCDLCSEGPHLLFPETYIKPETE